LLFLPILKVNTFNTRYAQVTNGSVFDNSLVVLVDQVTENNWNSIPASEKSNNDGVIYGYSLNLLTYLQIDQGLDTTQINQAIALSADLKETQYIVEIDNRLGIVHKRLSSQNNLGDAVRSFVDDDGVAQYFFSLVDTDFVKNIVPPTNGAGTNQVIAGPLGTSIEFKIRPSLNAATSTYLFNLLGVDFTSNGKSFKVIKSYVIVTGATTGYSLEVPVCYVKSV
jgi:hypothetical protein